MNCDTCGDEAQFLVFYAYHAPTTLDPAREIHPTFARYPVARHRACDQHIAYVMRSDIKEGDRKWVVEVVA